MSSFATIPGKRFVMCRISRTRDRSGIRGILLRDAGAVGRRAPARTRCSAPRDARCRRTRSAPRRRRASRSTRRGRARRRSPCRSRRRRSRRRRACRPRPRSESLVTASIVSKTATSTFFIALVRMCGPRNDWSLSTPMPQTLPLLRRLKRPQAAPARLPRTPPSNLGDLRERELLALRLVDEVLRIALLHRHARGRSSFTAVR